MNTSVFFSFSYGLYLLTAKDGNKQNGCIINTVCQTTSDPPTVSLTVNKLNYTHALLTEQDSFNVSVLDKTAPFSLFQQFGFQSGRTVDKFAGMKLPVSENGLYYLDTHAAAYFSGEITDRIDLGSHTLFLARVTAGEPLSKNPPLTYADYHSDVKPKPQKTNIKGWRCKICGYIYEGETLPPDIICPICKHGAADFEPIV